MFDNVCDLFKKSARLLLPEFFVRTHVRVQVPVRSLEEQVSETVPYQYFDYLVNVLVTATQIVGRDSLSVSRDFDHSTRKLFAVVDVDRVTHTVCGIDFREYEFPHFGMVRQLNRHRFVQTLWNVLDGRDVLQYGRLFPSRPLRGRFELLRQYIVPVRIVSPSNQMLTHSGYILLCMCCFLADLSIDQRGNLPKIEDPFFMRKQLDVKKMDATANFFFLSCACFIRL